MKAKKFLAGILSAAMILSLLPTTAFASETGTDVNEPTTETSGTGTETGTQNLDDGDGTDAGEGTKTGDLTGSGTENTGETNDADEQTGSTDGAGELTGIAGEGSGNEEDATESTTSDDSSSAQIVKGDNVSTYATLEAAINAASTEADTTITLLKNITESVTIPANTSVTLDLAGYTITNEEGSHTITNQGTLIIQDSSETQIGTVDNISNGKGAIYNDTTGSCTLLSGTYTRSNAAGTYSPYSGNGNSWYVVKNYGSMVIGASSGSEGSVKVNMEDEYSSLIANGWQNASTAGQTGKEPAIREGGAELVINCGTFSGGINTVKNDDYGVLTVNGGTFTNVAQAALLNWNEATIAGGNFSVEKTGTAVIINGYAATDENYDQGKLNISGGTFTAAEGLSVIANYDSDESIGEITISGGTFIAGEGATGIFASDEYSGTIAVSGGTFSMQVPEIYCASGYISGTETTTDNMYTVVVMDENNSAAKVVTNEIETYCKSVQEALDLANDGTTKSSDIYLYQNVNENLTWAPGKYKVITLYLNGFTITGRENAPVLTVKGFSSDKFVIKNVSSGTKDSGSLVQNSVGQPVIDLQSGRLFIYKNVTLSGGTYNVNAGHENTTVTAKLSIYGGTYESSETAAFHLSQDAEAVIYGGTVKSESYGILQEGIGTIKISNDSYGGDISFECGKSAIKANSGSGEIQIFKGSYTITSEGSLELLFDIASGVTMNVKNTYTPLFSQTFDEEYLGEGLVFVGPNDDGMYGLMNVVAKVTHDGVTTNYETLSEALTESQDGDTVTLNQKVKNNRNNTEITKSIIFDLNGYEFAQSAGYIVVNSGCDVTIKNGTITHATADGNPAIYSLGKLTVESLGVASNSIGIQVGSVGTTNYNGELIVNEKTEIVGGSEYCGIMVVGICSDIPTEEETNLSKLTVNGGIITGGSFAVCGNGTNHGTVITINGGTIGSEDCKAGIYHPQYGTLNISGGTIQGKTGIEMRAGILNVTGDDANISSTALSEEWKVEANASGMTTTGAGIAVAQHTTNLPIEVNISGGSVSGNYALYESNPQKNDEESIAQVKITINGGTFTGTNEEKSSVYSEDCTEFVSGGRFSNQVPVEYCAEGYVPTTVADENNMYTVEPKKYDVILYSALENGDVTSVAMLTGGGTYEYGYENTVKAESKDGYNFKGWYEVIEIEEDSGQVTKITYGETPVSTRLEYSFFVNKNTSLVAVYEAVKKVNLSVSSSNFKVNGVLQQGTAYQNQFDVGTQITLEHTGSDTFHYWKNGSNKIISTSNPYTFTIVSNTDISTLITQSGSEEQKSAYVEFVSFYDQVLQATTWVSGGADIYTLPAGPSKFGSTFLYWSLDGENEATVDSILAEIAKGETTCITLRPVYQESDTTYTVTVHYPEGTLSDDTYTELEGNGLTVSAKRIDGKEFSHWSDRADGSTILSYSQDYFLMVGKNIDLYAIYSESEVEKYPVVTITNCYSSTVDGVNKVSFEATRDIPDGYILIEHGIVYGIKEDFSGENGKDKLVVDGSGVAKLISKDESMKGVYIAHIKVGNSTDTIVYARGFVTVRNEQGNIETYYTDIASGSYNSLNSLSE